MAGSKSAYLENVALDIFLGAVTYTAPTIVYIALSGAAFNKNATGSTFTEISSSGTGYSRVAVTNNSTNWPNATASTKSNNAVFTYPAATTPWGAIQSFYIVDASSGGNVLYGCDLTVTRSVNTGDTASFAVSAITLTEV